MGKERQLVDHTVCVITVAVAEEEVATVIDLIPFVGGGILHDKALLLEAFTNIVVHVTEPLLQFRVTIGISVHVVNRID